MRKSSVVAMTDNVTGEIKNPLSGISKAELMADVERFAEVNDLMDEVELLKKGALVAQNPGDFENLAELDEEDRAHLRIEITNRWRHPKVCGPGHDGAIHALLDSCGTSLNGT